MRVLPGLGFALLFVSVLAVAQTQAPIDRQALVARHSPKLSSIERDVALMVGNGNFAFAADITGLQTFQEQYSPRVPLMTQAQWAWHSFPSPRQYRIEDALKPVEVRGSARQYPWLRSWDEAKQPHILWLRENPHRFSLGRLALHLVNRGGEAARYGALRAPVQQLDLWRGALLSSFEFDGATVQIETRVHPELDMAIVTLRSPLLERGQLAVDLKFPGVAAQLNPDPADWNAPDRHATVELDRTARELSLERRLDDTRYFVRVNGDRDLDVASAGPHTLRIASRARNDSLTLLVQFSAHRDRTALPSSESAVDHVSAWWKRYWMNGGVIDFSGSTDPRAFELERRVVLSQYLMAVNAAGSLPPQEEGLFSNSWNGKFHLEMHPWHAAHFATWGRTELLERSMPWYAQHLAEAKARARGHGTRGAWWPKMVGPEGRESPSTINPFIMWQQPHPVFLSELIYRSRPERATLERYRDIVFETAELLASYPFFDATRERYIVGPPIVPAQEVYAPLETFNPTFEVEYFRFGLMTAQRWRERLGLERDSRWQQVIEKLTPLPHVDGLYLPVESEPDFWRQTRSSACGPRNPRPPCLNRDHPSMLAALGLLPGERIDREMMRRTFDAVLEHWDLRQTWGWDFPMMAMTAARLGDPQRAVDMLFLDVPNNRFGAHGMTPRMHLSDDSATNEYQAVAATYFPSNGALLLAVGLMAAGWGGGQGDAPGFPQDGRWKVRVEGVQPMP